ncbi:UDP-N-acetylmuramate dehydrogenase [Shewanella sp. KX20019]|uniref:UDP-N-acetylmuramate dehydrogenase n=1 Tax=Shewanella sp. KX20019 TaxID=2803864 RepID=UPI00192661CE|nr:UDP-N-acetylmuramate dehydrogenase [Shewanella sp. KX20019]QQX82668.1 UDP-N-acetylmuramate dehydrogenase [Shewanella sp. KX20019]
MLLSSDKKTASVTHSVSLKSHNSFGLEHTCRELIVVKTTEQLISCCLALYQAKEPMLVLGGGSNVIFCDDFEGTVVLVNTRGVEVTTIEGYYLLSVAAGEDWHELICFCLEQGIAGFENLALIPGKVGAAPIQNIGAYGVELNDLCEWVEYIDLSNGECIRLNAQDCEFAYRDSIFKQQLLGKAVITQVGFKVAKAWQPKLDYGPLKALKNTDVTPKEVFDCICQTRMAKLPDPKKVGNAGSFFKNPVITNEQFSVLVDKFPGIVGYPQGMVHTKIAAGWLIEAAGLKGYQIGGAAVHQNQALVLINRDDATSDDILALAKHIVNCVEALFGVKLEVEPRIIAATGERSL